MRVKYVRFSSVGQSAERQLLDKADYDKIYTEQVSGSISMDKRDVGSTLLNDIKSGKVKELHLEALDRIGRDALDVMKSLRVCEEMGVNVVISNLGIQSLVEGKRNEMFALVTGIVASLAENERRNIAERCLSGRIAAQRRGVKFGRKEGVIESDTKFFSKVKVKEIVKDLQKEYPYAVIAKNRECSITLVQKVSNKLKEVKKVKVVKEEALPQLDLYTGPVGGYDWDNYGEDGEKPITWNTQNDKPSGMATWVPVIKK